MKLLTIITKKIKNLFQKKKQSEYEVTKYGLAIFDWTVRKEFIYL